MALSVFEKPGRFWRGNLHTHSNRSDGVLEPAEVCRRYKAEGYDFISLTDHFIGSFDYPIVDTTHYRDNHFTTILGAELHSGPMQNGELWHILAVGLPVDFEPPNAPHFTPVEGQESGPEIAARARKAGAFVAIAHPEWSGLTMEDARSIESAHAVEVYNHGSEIACDRGSGFHTADLLLSEGRRLTLCATDDAHFTEHDHFGGWVMVKAQENTPDALLTALKEGDYYSSQGPDFLNMSMGDQAIVVNCTAVSTVIIQGPGIAAGCVHGHSMTRAEIPLGRFAKFPWIRITIVDAAGKKAWSNPIWL